MNSKTAKRLRREARYHPGLTRKYNQVGGGSPIELTPNDPRVLYKELKREYKTN